MGLDWQLKSRILLSIIISVYIVIIALIAAALDAEWYEVEREDWSQDYSFYMTNRKLSLFQIKVKEGYPSNISYKWNFLDSYKEENVDTRFKYEEFMINNAIILFVSIAIWVASIICIIVAFFQPKNIHSRRAMITLPIILIVFVGVGAFRFVTIPKTFKEDLAFNCNYAYWCDSFKGSLGVNYWKPKEGFSMIVAAFVFSVLGTILCILQWFVLKGLKKSLEKNSTKMSNISVGNQPAPPVVYANGLQSPGAVVYVNQPNVGYSPPPPAPITQPGPAPPGFTLVQQQIPVIGPNGTPTHYTTQYVYQPI
ncbi:hypothetical protein PPL_12572 [Heterostelium album PN500]|uniref:Uncharacterized protein n=1 Tax=Heterostelium pallidum (strain ATCC 26659 / Pp 5 / PN500) TaxID=670386 RepID=D3BMZ8_HETP5|nr:hypothetical protein PPL_12572 [Heterostelium album PN500]EFA77360.1 hypothetical protein PPL_12572 [Heterostelium album PN500]|eukprot:XP_020429489.1 hypothetical protein PPL_12572 [Heterostelium album PN500]